MPVSADQIRASIRAQRAQALSSTQRAQQEGSGEGRGVIMPLLEGTIFQLQRPVSALIDLGMTAGFEARLAYDIAVHGLDSERTRETYAKLMNVGSRLVGEVSPFRLRSDAEGIHGIEFTPYASRGRQVFGTSVYELPGLSISGTTREGEYLAQGSVLDVLAEDLGIYNTTLGDLAQSENPLTRGYAQLGMLIGAPLAWLSGREADELSAVHPFRLPGLIVESFMDPLAYVSVLGHTRQGMVASRLADFGGDQSRMLRQAVATADIPVKLDDVVRVARDRGWTEGIESAREFLVRVNTRALDDMPLDKLDQYARSLAEQSDNNTVRNALSLFDEANEIERTLGREALELGETMGEQYRRSQAALLVGRDGETIIEGGRVMRGLEQNLSQTGAVLGYGLGTATAGPIAGIVGAEAGRRIGIIAGRTRAGQMLQNAVKTATDVSRLARNVQRTRKRGEYARADFQRQQTAQMSQVLTDFADVIRKTDPERFAKREDAFNEAKRISQEFLERNAQRGPITGESPKMQALRHYPEEWQPSLRKLNEMHNEATIRTQEVDYTRGSTANLGDAQRAKLEDLEGRLERTNQEYRQLIERAGASPEVVAKTQERIRGKIENVLKKYEWSREQIDKMADEFTKKEGGLLSFVDRNWDKIGSKIDVVERYIERQIGRTSDAFRGLVDDIDAFSNKLREAGRKANARTATSIGGRASKKSASLSRGGAAALDKTGRLRSGAREVVKTRLRDKIIREAASNHALARQLVETRLRSDVNRIMKELTPLMQSAPTALRLDLRNAVNALLSAEHPQTAMEWVLLSLRRIEAAVADGAAAAASKRQNRLLERWQRQASRITEEHASIYIDWFTRPDYLFHYTTREGRQLLERVPDLAAKLRAQSRKLRTTHLAENARANPMSTIKDINAMIERMYPDFKRDFGPNATFLETNVAKIDQARYDMAVRATEDRLIVDDAISFAKPLRDDDPYAEATAKMYSDMGLTQIRISDLNKILPDDLHLEEVPGSYWFKPDDLRALESTFQTLKNPNAIQEFWDKTAIIGQVWKRFALWSGAYHARNVLGGVWNNVLMGVTNPIEYYRFTRAQVAMGIANASDEKLARIAPEMASSIIGMTAGAVAGAITSEDEPITGALGGAVVGGIGGNLAARGVTRTSAFDWVSRAREKSSIVSFDNVSDLGTRRASLLSDIDDAISRRNALSVDIYDEVRPAGFFGSEPAKESTISAYIDQLIAEETELPRALNALRAEKEQLSSGVINKIRNRSRLEQIDREINRISAKISDLPENLNHQMRREVNRLESALDKFRKDLEVHEAILKRRRSKLAEEVATAAPEARLAEINASIGDATGIIPSGNRKIDLMASVDRAVSLGTATETDGAIIKSILDNTPEENLSNLTELNFMRLRDGISGTTSLYNTGEVAIGITPSGPKREAQASTFAHELSHYSWFTILNDADRSRFSEIYDSIGQERLYRHFVGRSTPEHGFKSVFQLSPDLASHWAKNREEAFAALAAEYIITRKVPAFVETNQSWFKSVMDKVLGVIKRVASDFKERVGQNYLSNQHRDLLKEADAMFEKIFTPGGISSGQSVVVTNPGGVRRLTLKNLTSGPETIKQIRNWASRVLDETHSTQLGTMTTREIVQNLQREGALSGGFFDIDFTRDMDLYSDRYSSGDPYVNLVRYVSERGPVGKAFEYNRKLGVILENNIRGTLAFKSVTRDNHTFQEAARLTWQAQFDYEDITPAFREVFRHPFFGAPFLTYTAKNVPFQLVQGLLTNPGKLAIFQRMVRAHQEAVGGGATTLELNDWMVDRFPMIARREANGEVAVFVGEGWFTVTDLQKALDPAMLGADIYRATAPLPRAVFEFTQQTGADAYRGVARERLGQRFERLAGSAIRGVRDVRYLGADEGTLGERIGRSSGFRSYSVDPERRIALERARINNVRQEYERKISETDSDNERQRLRAAMRTRIRLMRNRLRDAMAATTERRSNQQ